MRWLAHLSRGALVGGIALVLSAILSLLGQTVEARPGGDAVLEIHKAVCPAGYEGEDYFTDCHANGRAGDVFSLAGPGGRQEATTIVVTDPGPGIVVFPHLPGGVYKLSETPPTGTASTAFRVFCFLAETEDPIPVKRRGSGIAVDVAAGERVLCDWYTVPPGS